MISGVSVASSVLTIMILSVDRYLAINHPMTFTTFSKDKKTIKIVISIIWIISFGTMVPLLIARKLDEFLLPIVGETLYFCKESWSDPWKRQLYDVILFLLMFVIPGLLITVSYSQIGRQLWTENRDLCRNDSKVGKELAERVMTGRRRVARMLVFVAILFGVCWMPYHLLTLYIDFEVDIKNSYALEALPFTILLGHSNSAINPVIYCFMNKSFRKNTLKVLKCRKRRRRSSSKKKVKEQVQ